MNAPDMICDTTLLFFKNVQIINGSVRLQAKTESSYLLQEKNGREMRLSFSSAYRIEERDWGTGVDRCDYQVFDRAFRNLSCMNGKTLRRFLGGCELRKHADGTQFLFFQRETPTCDVWDRVWNGVEQLCFYQDKHGIHLIVCKHGYRIAGIDIYLHLEKHISMLPLLQALSERPVENT